MNKDLCELINGIDGLIKVEKNDSAVEIISDKILNDYCPNNEKGLKRKTGEKGQCIGYNESIISAYISFLKNYESANSEEKIESGKLAQYAILWLCYKINQHLNITGGIDNIYNEIIGYDYWNSNYHSYIEHIKNLKDMDIKIICNFYEAFKILCNIYTEFDEGTQDCNNYLGKAKEFVDKYNELNKDPNITEDSPYYQVWSILSTDYDNFKKKCGNNQSSNFPSLPQIKPAKNSVHDSMQSSEDISSSPIATKLIPVLSTFAAIPIFFGIAYKAIFKRKVKKTKEENESLYVI
ncbi:Plasmodium variant antigen protein Cir/Yir/Bir, putative [Plasmodium chabaudi adami]|uniref:Plasmodium variant antigen protein Cir/Yir/Bir, putative n=1 Tax=Plasmodium chabaudi adami TaxID=5826 RepID=A0A1D3LB81_PLACE|nr:Plasmodium variant antigen protein Cir/Yir/Bir, putative [Plasmodium chabaudi adami]